MESTHDLTFLDTLDIATVVSTLQRRYEQRKIYTNLASVLVAINPYEKHVHHEALLGNTEPHVINVAKRAVRMLQQYDPRTATIQNQSIICSGYSGSGKTESCRQILRHLCGGSTESNHIQQLEASNIVLEMIGNAATIRNRNSSRFAKYLQLHFHKTTSQYMGAHIATFLLEQTRLTHVPPQEGNFHIFYALESTLAKEYRGLTMNWLPALEYEHHPTTSSQVSWMAWGQALKQFGFQDSDLQRYKDLLTGLLLFGHDPEKYLSKISTLWHVPLHDLQHVLHHRVITAGTRDRVECALNVKERIIQRDAMARSLYQLWFQHIVTRMNQCMGSFHTNADTRTIGLLDIFGFECFQQNSLEQFCINWANEKLQEFFNQQLLLAEQNEYVAEGLQFTPLPLPSGQETLQLIENRPSGILSLLDSACVMPKGSSDLFVEHLFTAHKQHPKLARTGTTMTMVKRPPVSPRSQASFVIHHYAQSVTYQAHEFLTKNNDATIPEWLIVMQKSPALGILIPKANHSTAQSNPNTRFKSVTRLFHQQLTSLFQDLQQTTCHFVRCINPNHHKQPNQFDVQFVKEQLVHGGIVEAINVLKHGFTYRVPLDRCMSRILSQLVPEYLSFVPSRFSLLAKHILPASDTYQVGKTKLFFYPEHSHTGQAFLTQLNQQTWSPEQLTEIARQIRQANRLRVTTLIHCVQRCAQWLQKTRIKRRWTLLMTVAQAVVRWKRQAARAQHRKTQQMQQVAVKQQWQHTETQLAQETQILRQDLTKTQVRLEQEFQSSNFEELARLAEREAHLMKQLQTKESDLELNRKRLALLETTIEEHAVWKKEYQSGLEQLQRQVSELQQSNVHEQRRLSGLLESKQKQHSEQTQDLQKTIQQLQKIIQTKDDKIRQLCTQLNQAQQNSLLRARQIQTALQNSYETQVKRLESLLQELSNQ